MSKNKIFQIIFFIILITFTNSKMVNTYIESDPSQSSNPDLIQGKMIVNGEEYNTICDCSENNIQKQEDLPSQIDTEKCDPSKLSIINEKPGVGASLDDVKELIGNVEKLDYVHVTNTEFTCMDGRHPNPVLSTPGGDAGEFILALSIYEDIVGNDFQLDQDKVTKLLGSYLKFMSTKKFDMCTDDEAISHLEKRVDVIGFSLVNPQAQLRKELFKYIVEPENIGDLHLRAMLKSPESYNIRKEIPEMFIRSFYSILWNTNNDLSTKLQLTVLNGHHSESGFVEVRSENACQKAELAPLIPTKNKKVSVFVNHLDAISIRRKQLAQFFSDSKLHHLDSVSEERMYNRLNHHGFAALEVTGSLIAKDLPFDTINLA